MADHYYEHYCCQCGRWNFIGVLNKLCRTCYDAWPYKRSE